MLYSQHFIIRGKYLGAAKRDLIPVQGEMQPPYSYAYFCPCCGELWARLPVWKGDTATHTPFHVLSIACDKCPASCLQVPGSLYLPWDAYFMQNLPDEVINREFHIHLNYYEKSQ